MNNPIRILLVDDSPYFLAAAREFLQFQDALTVVDVATEEQEALAKSLKGEPDVILLDLNLAHRSGLELIPLFRNHLPQVKIIVLTMMDADSYRAAALQAGADAFVHKSEMIGMLHSVIMKSMNFPADTEHLPAIAAPAEMEMKKIKKALQIEPGLISRLPDEIRTRTAITSSLLNSMAEGVLVVEDASGYIAHINQPLLSLLGYAAEELLEQHWSIVIAKRELEKVKRQSEQRPSNAATQYETIFTTKQGYDVPVLVAATPVFQDDQFICTLLTVMDISERRHAEEDLAYQARLFANVSDAVVSTDAALSVRSWNNGAERMFGYTAEEMIGQNARDILAAEYISSTREAAMKQLNERGYWEGEVLMHHKDGSVIYAIAAGSVLRDEAGNINGFVSVNHDITERKRTEENVIISEERLKLATHAGGVGVWDWDIVKNLLTWDDSMYSLYGLGKSDFGGAYEAWSRTVHPDDHEFVDGEIQAAIRNEREYAPEFRIVRPDGSIRIIKATSQTIRDQGGKALRMVGTNIDITERKRAEGILRENEKVLKESQSIAGLGNYRMDITTGKWKGSEIFNDVLGINETFVRTLESWTVLVHPDDRRLIVDHITNQVIANHTRLDKEFRIIRHKDQTERWVHVLGEVEVDSQDQLKVVGTVQDITERKQAEEKIQQSEDRYRDLVENSQDLICTHDLEGTILSANPTSARLLGYELDELIGKNLRDFMAPEVRGHFKYYINRLTQRGSASGLLLMQTKQGERRIWEYQNSVRSEGVAEPIVRGMARDITEHKRAEDEIRRLKEFNENLINNMSEGIVVQNTDGNFTFVNPAASVITGYLPEELLGKHWTNFFSADQQGIINEADNRRLAGEASQYETDFLHKSGKQINMLVSGSPLFENTRFIGTMAVFTDITERKQAEEKIRAQLERLTALREIDQVITSTHDVGTSLDILMAHTVKQLAVDAVTVLLLNSATNTLEYGTGFGFWTDAVKTASIELGESYAGRVATEGHIVDIPNLAEEPHNLLLTGFLKDENFISYHGAPLIVKGKVIGVLEVFHRSVAERDGEWLDFFNTLAGQAAIAVDNAKMFEDLQHTNIELEMRVEERTAELTKANRAKDEFLAGMSHELRTPLNAVLNMSESLEEGTYGELKPRQVDILRIIAESGRHLLELINDILDLSKIEAGKLELQAGLVSVESFCQASMRMIKETTFQKRLQVSISNTSNIEVIHADERRLKQMLVNLLSNAVKFTPAGGQVGLEVSREGDHALRFSVWDSGIGIPADQLEKLFQPFVQLDSSLSRQYTGTGLGLSLVRNLAELHGGSVGVESELGRGSRFYFIIPTQLLNAPIMESAKSPAGLKPNETKSKHMGEKRGILLVEDNVTNMLVTSDYLNDKGYQVIGARDGFEAIEYALEQKPDLILMDIQMPGLNGFEAIKRIRAAPGFDSVPIVALTALAMPGDRERCLEAGANEYLSKPVSFKGLIQLIETLLKNET